MPKIEVTVQTWGEIHRLRRKLELDPSSQSLQNDLWTFFADVRSSFELAMRGASFSDNTISEILNTVDDYVSREYGG